MKQVVGQGIFSFTILLLVAMFVALCGSVRGESVVPALPIDCVSGAVLSESGTPVSIYDMRCEELVLEFSFSITDTKSYVKRISRERDSFPSVPVFTTVKCYERWHSVFISHDYYIFGLQKIVV